MDIERESNPADGDVDQDGTHLDGPVDLDLVDLDAIAREIDHIESALPRLNDGTYFDPSEHHPTRDQPPASA